MTRAQGVRTEILESGLRAVSYQLTVPPDPVRISLWPPFWVKGGGGVSHRRPGAPRRAKLVIRQGSFTNPIRLYPLYTSLNNSAFWRFEPGGDDAAELARLWLSVDQPYCVAVETDNDTDEDDIIAVGAAPVGDAGIDVSTLKRVHFTFGGVNIVNISSYALEVWVRLGESGGAASAVNWTRIGSFAQSGLWSDYIDVQQGWSRLFFRAIEIVNTAAGPTTLSVKYGHQGGRAANVANSTGTLEVMAFYEDLPGVEF